MNKRLIDSRNKQRPVAFPQEHPDCRRPHFKSPVQMEILDRAIDVQMERDYLRRSSQHDQDGCDDLHCIYAINGYLQSMVTYQAERNVLERRLLLAEQLIRHPNDTRTRAQWERARDAHYDTEVTEEADRLREQMTARTIEVEPRL